MDGGAGLDRREVTFPGEDADTPKKSDRQREKRLLTGFAGALLPEEGVARCGKKVSRLFETDAETFVGLQKHADGGSFAGVVSCHSVWHCPVCASRIAIGRQREVKGIVSLHQATGGKVTMTTLTLRHNVATRVATIKKDVSTTWSKMRGTRAFKQAEGFGGVVGGVRSLEVTHGQNGWHPHLHILTFFDAKAGDAAIEAYQEKLIALWIDKAAARGYICERAGQDWRWADTPGAAGDYVTKWGVDWELTHAHLKKSKGGRSPFQILADYARDRNSQDGALFREYALAFKGARQLTWFGDVRKTYDAPELDDAEIAADEDETEIVGFLNADGFHHLRRRRLVEEFLSVVAAGGRFMEYHGHIGLQVWLDVRRVPAMVRPPGYAARFRRPMRKSHDGEKGDGAVST